MHGNWYAFLCRGTEEQCGEFCILVLTGEFGRQKLEVRQKIVFFLLIKKKSLTVKIGDVREHKVWNIKVSGARLKYFQLGVSIHHHRRSICSSLSQK